MAGRRGRPRRATGLECRQPGTQRNHIQWSVAGLRRARGRVLPVHLPGPLHAAASRRGSSGLMQNGPPYTAYAETEAAPAHDRRRAGPNTRSGSARRHTAADARLTWYLGGALPAGTTLTFSRGSLCRGPVQPADPLDRRRRQHHLRRRRGHGRQAVERRGPAAGRRLLLRCPHLAGAAPRGRQPGHAPPRIELALRRHIIDQSNRGYVTYENLDLRYGAAHGIGGGRTHHITVRDCDISYIGGGHQFTPAGRQAGPLRQRHRVLGRRPRLPGRRLPAVGDLRRRADQPGQRHERAGEHHLPPQRDLELRVLVRVLEPRAGQPDAQHPLRAQHVRQRRPRLGPQPAARPERPAPDVLRQQLRHRGRGRSATTSSATPPTAACGCTAATGPPR